MGRRSPPPPLSFFAFQDIITSVVGIFVLISIIMVLELLTRVSHAETPSESTNTEPTASEVQALEEEMERVTQRYQQTKARRDSRSLMTSDFETEKVKMDAQILQSNQQKDRLEALLQERQRELAELQQEQRKLEEQEKERTADREELARLEQLRKILDQQIADLESDDPLIFRSQTTEGRQLVLVVLSKGKIQLNDTTARSSISFTGKNRLQDFDGWIAKNLTSKLQFLVLLRPSAVIDFAPVTKSLQDQKANYGFDFIGESRKIKLNYPEANK